MSKFRIHPLSQLEGDIGASSSEVSAESPSVVADQDTEIASVSTHAEEQISDVTQQESFASRLKEEKNKIEESYSPIKAHYSQLESVARLAGFDDVGQYLTALDDHAKQQHAESEAQRLNVDEETYRKYFEPLSTDLSKTKEELNTLRQAEINRAVRSEYDRLKSTHSDFETVQDQVFELASNRNMPLEDAYKLVVFDQRMNDAKTAGQQEAIQKLQNNASTSSGPVGGDTPDQKFDFKKLSLDERQKYYERAKRGELTSLR